MYYCRWPDVEDPDCEKDGECTHRFTVFIPDITGAQEEDSMDHMNGDGEGNSNKKKEESPQAHHRGAPCSTLTTTKFMKLWGACVASIHLNRSTRICQSHIWAKRRTWTSRRLIGWPLWELRSSTATDELHTTMKYFSCGGMIAL